MITVKLSQFVSQVPNQPSQAGQALFQLSGLPLAPKVKYRIARIIDWVNAQVKALNDAHLRKVRELGEPVEWVADDPQEDGVQLASQPKGKWVPIIDPKKLAAGQLQYRVKPENQAEFDRWMDDTMNADLTCKWGPIPVADIANAHGEPVDIAFDVSPILWMLADEDD